MHILRNEDGFINANNEIFISSRMVAEKIGKEHYDILKKIKEIDLGDGECSLSSYLTSQNKKSPEYLLTKNGFILLLMNYQGYMEFKRAYIKKFDVMEKALREFTFRQGDKRHQIECMETLQGLLPETDRVFKISYIKANVVVNKATSNYFGFPKMLKKSEMSSELLRLREKVLDDYIKLLEVYETTEGIKEFLYNKYKINPLFNN